MTVNLIDTRPIDNYLESFLPSDPQAAGLLKLALGKVLARRPANMRELTGLPADAPDWLRAKWPHGGPFHAFEPDSGLDQRVRHIADWLKVAVRDHDEWLAKVDGQGRAHKLLKLGTLEQAEAEADKAMQLRNKRLAAQMVPDDEGEETVMVMEDNYRIVRLATTSALDREGVAMGHCIGQGAYDDALRDGSRKFFSLRDPQNRPHATVEVNTSAHAVVQCQGKENKAPVARYLPYLQAFLKKERYHLDVPASRTGLVEVNGECLNIHDLPANLSVEGNLDLEDTPITRLPDGLSVSGDLDLRGTPITRLPDGLRVDDFLDLRGTPITRLPDGLNVGGNLYLCDTPITHLPDGLSVGGNLYLNDTPITHLPEGLRVGGDLYLNDTPITHLPDGLSVGGDLDLGGAPITHLPDGLRVGGSLYLSRTPITDLPDGLCVRASLDLRGTPIIHLPDGLSVGGFLDLGGTPIIHLPDGLSVGGYLNLNGTPITHLPDGLSVGGDLYLLNTPMTSLPRNLKVGDDLHLEGSNIREVPPDAVVKGKVTGMASMAGKYAVRDQDAAALRR